MVTSADTVSKAGVDLSVGVLSSEGPPLHGPGREAGNRRLSAMGAVRRTAPTWITLPAALCVFQKILHAMRLFPDKFGQLPSEMSVGCGPAEDRSQQVEILNDPFRRKIEYLPHDLR